MSEPHVSTPPRERLRSAITNLLPEELGRLYSRTRTAMHLGWKDSGRLSEATHAPPGDILEFEMPGIPNPVYVRTGSTDADTLEACLVRMYYARLKPQHPVQFIIDAGANAGYSAIFFLERYRDSVVVALEPDPENYNIALRNLSPYGNRCHLLKDAIWPTRARLLLKRSDRHDATQVIEAAGPGECCSGVIL